MIIIKNVMIVGATGMIGGLVLKSALADEHIGKVISIVRKPTGVTDEKLVEIIHNNFLNFTTIEESFKDIDIAYFCVGVYTGSVPRDEFRIITVDYTKVFADTLIQHSPDTTLCFLSGMGADRSEKSRMMFAQDKGIAENYILSKNFKELYIFRPGYIYPVIPREEPNLSYSLYRKLYPLMNFLIPNSSVTSEHLAKAMFKVGLDGTDKDTLGNKDIRSIEI